MSMTSLIVSYSSNVALISNAYIVVHVFRLIIRKSIILNGLDENASWQRIPDFLDKIALDISYWHGFRQPDESLTVQNVFSGPRRGGKPNCT